MDANVFTCPTVTRKIAGQDFTLRMDFNALALAEQLSRANLLDDRAWSDMTVSTLTALFWASIVQGGHSDVTLTQVRALGYKHAAEMVDAVRAAWRAVNELPEEDPRPTSGSKRTKRSNAPAQ